MGAAFLAGLTGGMAQSIQHSRQQSIEQEYRKALIEHSKLQTKLLENQIQLAQAKQNMSGGIFSVLSQIPGMEGLAQTIPQQPQPLMQPTEQPRPQGLLGLLGRVFNPQPNMTSPQPSAQTQQSIPQIVAQGQVAPPSGQPTGQPRGRLNIENLTPAQAFALDAAVQQGLGFDPKFREHAGRAKWYGTPAEGMYRQDPYGNIGGVIPPGQKWVQQEITDDTGARHMVWVPVPQMQSPLFGAGQVGMGASPMGGPGVRQPGAIGPYGMQTQASPLAIPPKIPEKVDEYIATTIDPINEQLDWLAKTAKPNYFGLKAQLEAEALENKWTSPLTKVAEGIGLAQIAPKDREDFLNWYKTIWKLQNTEIHSFGGSTLTAQELMRKLKELTTPNTTEGFNAGIEATKRASKAYKDSVYGYYGQSQMQRGAATLGSTPSLPGAGIKATPEEIENEFIRRGYKRNSQGQWVK